MAAPTRDPIAGLVLAVCDYLAVFQSSNADAAEVHEKFMIMFVKAKAVERAYGRGVAKAVDHVDGIDGT